MPAISARRGINTVLPPALQKAHVGATKKTWTCKCEHLPHTAVQPPMAQSSPASAPAAVVVVNMDDAQKVLKELPQSEDPSWIHVIAVKNCHGFVTHLEAALNKGGLHECDVRFNCSFVLLPKACTILEATHAFRFLLLQRLHGLSDGSLTMGFHTTI